MKLITSLLAVTATAAAAWDALDLDESVYDAAFAEFDNLDSDVLLADEDEDDEDDADDFDRAAAFVDADDEEDDDDDEEDDDDDEDDDEDEHEHESFLAAGNGRRSKGKLTYKASGLHGKAGCEWHCSQSCALACPFGPAGEHCRQPCRKTCRKVTCSFFLYYPNPNYYKYANSPFHTDALGHGPMATPGLIPRGQHKDPRIYQTNVMSGVPPHYKHPTVQISHNTDMLLAADPLSAQNAASVKDGAKLLEKSYQFEMMKEALKSSVRAGDQAARKEFGNMQNFLNEKTLCKDEDDISCQTQNLYDGFNQLAQDTAMPLAGIFGGGTQELAIRMSEAM